MDVDSVDPAVPVPIARKIVSVGFSGKWLSVWGFAGKEGRVLSLIPSALNRKKGPSKGFNDQQRLGDGG
ncbi:MAG: hypothetical protein NVSMB14_11220 [Isosphaeraceae bacterium]